MSTATKNGATQNRTRGALIAIGVLCITASFAAGVRTSGSVQTVHTTEATDIIIAGDVTQDQVVDVRDALLILEIAQGYRSAEPEELKRDPNGDGQLTVADAMRILSDLADAS